MTSFGSRRIRSAKSGLSRDIHSKPESMRSNKKLEVIQGGATPDLDWAALAEVQQIEHAIRTQDDYDGEQDKNLAEFGVTAPPVAEVSEAFLKTRKEFEKAMEDQSVSDMEGDAPLNCVMTDHRLEEKKQQSLKKQSQTESRSQS